MGPIEIALIIIIVLAAYGLGIYNGYQYRRKQAFFRGHRAMGFGEQEIKEAWRKGK
jgi:hypothetical protein